MAQSEISPAKPFRAEDWWKSKASALMGFVYLFALWFDIPFLVFIPLSVFSIAVIMGFASFGYIVNDFFDKEKDRQAGKKNFLLDKSPAYQTGLILATLIFICFPWFYLPAALYSYILIGIQISLFLIYSVPPFRLKERGAAGLAVDASVCACGPCCAGCLYFLAGIRTCFPSSFALPFVYPAMRYRP